MVKKIDKNLIVALDIGTSKIVAIVGEITTDNEIEVIGIGSHQSRGLRRGVVVNIDSTTQSIQRAIEEAEFKTGYFSTSNKRMSVRLHSSLLRAGQFI